MIGESQWFVIKVRNREGGSGRDFNDDKFWKVEGKILKSNIDEVNLGIRVKISNTSFPVVMEREK